MKRTGTKTAIYIVLIITSLIALFPFVWTFIAATHSNAQIFNLAYTFIPENNFMENFRQLQKACLLGLTF